MQPSGGLRKLGPLHSRSQLTCADLRLEPILQPRHQGRQDVHAQKNYLQRETPGAGQRPAHSEDEGARACLAQRCPERAPTGKAKLLARERMLLREKSRSQF